MASPAEVKETHMRHECIGISYYSAWLASSRSAPVCLGFSQVKQESAAVDTAAEPQQQQPGQDFKQLCIGYSSYSAASTALPYCEGVELLMETAAEDKPDAPSTHSMQPQGHQQGTQQHQQQLAKQQHDAHSITQPQQPAHTAQVPEGGHEEEQVVPSTKYQRVMSKAVSNWAALQKGFSNEGPLKLKAWPQDWQEAQNRLLAEATRNGSTVAQGCRKLAAFAYKVTVKPVTDNLGITPRQKS